MLILFLFQTARAACDGPTRAADVTSSVSRAQLAFASLDVDGFADAAGIARDALPCLVEPLTPFDAAAFHGLMALAAFSEGNEKEAIRWLAAAEATEPNFTLPAVIAPPGGSVDALRSRARVLPSGAMEPVPPYDGRVLIDGSPGIVRPTERPCVLQLIRPDGTVERSYVLLPGTLFPAWAPPPAPVQRFIPQLREKPSISFALAAGGTALAAGGLYALGGVWHEQYLDPTTPYEDLPGLETQTNAALGASVALVVTAATFTTVTFVRW